MADPALERVSNVAALRALLAATDISVPARTDGRKTSHVERWSRTRLLATLAENDELAFPLTVMPRDRPDVLLDMCGKSIGIEITEAITEQYGTFCALAEREFPDAMLDSGHFRWGMDHLSIDEMRVMLRSRRLTSNGWVGDSPEQEWALYMESVVAAKRKKLSALGFETFDENWLCIYDNLPTPNVHLARAIAILQPMLAPHWAASPRFDRMMVERGPVIASIRPGDWSCSVVPDLGWKY